jgi:O-antigen chain-terminating methyltransferase
MSLNDTLVNYSDTRYEHLLSILENTTTEMSARQALLRQGIDAIRMQSRTTDSDTAPVLGGQVPADELIDDALYVALENHFRGSRDLVAERQRSYLGELPSVVSAEHPVVDLGCGRGEWLQALQAQRIAARGVDSNTVCVAECRSAGLDVELSGIIQYLRNQPDHSVGAFTLFQVLEHLTFPVLLDTMRHARRVLVPGGRLIAEVPNAKNLRVAAGTFWIDPTHERPLYPEFLLFLAEEVGFTSARGVYANDSSPKFDLSSLPEGPREALQRVVDAIDTAGDFALIATA